MGEIQIVNIEALLSEFKKLPKDTKETTYLEICKYPNRRFEEICSRILQFYFDPNKEHGFKDLFILSLFELIEKTDRIPDIYGLNVINEDNAEGKRIDLLIYSNDFVIGIENKITANVNNPLDIYKNRIEQYNSKNVYKLLLSLYKISDANELSLIKNNGFINIRYCEFFNKIKTKIGNYIGQCNLKYLTYLNDFMQTLENMEDNMPLNEQLSNFFFDKKDEINGFIKLYDEYNEIIEKKQFGRIKELLTRLKKDTKDDKWWIYEEWDLGHNNEKVKIGIESYYEATRDNMCGKFIIYLTSWNLHDWNKYEKKILKDFPKKKMEKEDGRVYLLVETIFNDDEELIIKKLIEYYNYYKSLLKNKD